MPAKRQIIATYVNTTCKTAPLLFGCFFTASVASVVLLLLLQAHSLSLGPPHSPVQNEANPCRSRSEATPCRSRSEATPCRSRTKQPRAEAEASTGRACKRQQSVAATHRAERTHPCRSGVTSTRQLVVHRKRLRNTHQQRQLPGEEGTHLRRSGGLGTRHTTSPSPHTLLQVIRRTKRRICFDLAATFCRNKKKAVAVSGRQHGLGDFSVLRWQKIILQR